MSTEKCQCVSHYIANLCEQLHKAFKEVQAQSTSEAERQREYYDYKANAISLEPYDLILAKTNAYKGRRKMKNQWEEEQYKVECRIAEGIPSYLMKNQQTRCSLVLHWNWLFLITPVMGAPLCSGIQAEQTMSTTTIMEELTQKANEDEEVPHSTKCLPQTQHQTGEAPLGQVNRKFCAFLRMFSGASYLDQGWTVWCRGKGLCGHQYQCSGGGGTDHTDEVRKIWQFVISSIPPLIVLEIASSKWEVQTGHAIPCIDLWDDHSVLNTDAEKSPGISYVRDPYQHCSTQME